MGKRRNWTASLVGVELVYFVRSGDFVKVGFTNNLPSRLGTLQTGSPYRIEVLGICEGSRQDEKDLHGYLERHRVGGEWFKLNHDQNGIGADSGRDSTVNSTGFNAGAPAFRRQYADDWDVKPDAGVFTACDAVCESMIVWGGQFFAPVLGDCGKWLVWDKCNTMPTFSDCELAWTNLPGVGVKMLRLNGNGLMADEPQRFHPTQKPVGLMLWCISKAKNPQSVIDPFLGSGTTLVACKKLGIRGVGIEREEKYCEIACKRILNTTPSLFSEER